MNKVILMGRLVKDPEIRYTQSGKNVATFTLAVDRGLGKDAPDNAPKADFIPIFSIVAFVAVVFYENYKYKKECKEWLKSRKEYK